MIDKKPDFDQAFFCGLRIDKGMKQEIEINTPSGRGILGYSGAPIVYSTELGYLMLKVWYPEEGVFINYKISNIKEILPPEFTIINNNSNQDGKSESTNVALG